MIAFALVLFLVFFPPHLLNSFARPTSFLALALLVLSPISQGGGNERVAVRVLGCWLGSTHHSGQRHQDRRVLPAAWGLVVGPM